MRSLVEAARGARLSGRDRPGPVQYRRRRRASISRGRRASRRRSSITRLSPTARASSARCRRPCSAQEIELVCLAGFMRLLTPWFVGQWRDRMLNIHPALLPSYRGLHTHERALGRRREDPRRHGAFRRPGNGRRPDHRPGRRAGAAGRYAGRARRAGAGAGAPDLSAGPETASPAARRGSKARAC